MGIRDNMDTMFSAMERLFSTKMVVGEPMEVGDITLVPITNISFGFGSGSGPESSESSSAGSGAAAGAKVSPLAVVVIRGDEISVLPLHGKSSTLERAIDLVPEVVDKVKKWVRKDQPPIE